MQYKRLDGVENALRVISGAFIDADKQNTVFDDVLNQHSEKIKIVWGAQDKIIPVSHAEKWQAKIDTVIISETGHMSHLEASSQVNQIIAEQVDS